MPETPMPPTVMDMAAAVRRRAVAPSALVDEALARIGDRDGALNSFVAVDGERARAQAVALEQRLARRRDDRRARRGARSA